MRRITRVCMTSSARCYLAWLIQLVLDQYLSPCSAEPQKELASLLSFIYIIQVYAIIMSLHDDTNAFRQTPTTEAYISRWKSASQEQDKVLSEVLARNLELETRVKSLEYENWTIRKMLEKCRADSQMDELTKQELKTRIDILNSEQESFRVRASLRHLNSSDSPTPNHHRMRTHLLYVLWMVTAVSSPRICFAKGKQVALPLPNGFRSALMSTCGNHKHVFHPAFASSS